MFFKKCWKSRRFKKSFRIDEKVLMVLNFVISGFLSLFLNHFIAIL
jgi:hypothetical protein